MTIRRHIAFSTLFLISATACAGTDSRLPELSGTLSGPYKLGPGDELRISVFGLDSMNNTYIVGDTGAIAVPMLDPVDVGGKTVREAETAVADKIRQRQLVIDPKVSAQVQTYRPFYITGEVQRPGQYPYVPGMSLATAVSVAGGYTFRADKKSATVTRTANQGRATGTTPILPGDTIVIPESWF